MLAAPYFKQFEKNDTEADKQTEKRLSEPICSFFAPLVAISGKKKLDTGPIGSYHIW